LSDASTAAKLRSEARLVVIESPAGCGKTHQAASYARVVSETIAPGRLLILTHTHAACDTIAKRARGRDRVEVRTIDSLITMVGSAYHQALGLPRDAAQWARAQGDTGYSQLADKVAALLRSDTIAKALAARYPIIICDEHQDSSPAQHSIVMALHRGGGQLRVFGDPMQRIYGRPAQAAALEAQWTELVAAADESDDLDVAHRWGNPPSELGLWILRARETLRAGGRINLADPAIPGLQVVYADNTAPRHGGLAVAVGLRRPISQFVAAQQNLLVLTPQNDLTWGLHGFFGRSIPLWEGHMRPDLEGLVAALGASAGDPRRVGVALVSYLTEVMIGFRKADHGALLEREIRDGCVTPRRGKPGAMQELAKCILKAPNHKGVAFALRRLDQLLKEGVLTDMQVVLRRAFWDACKLADFDDPDIALSEIARVRAYTRAPHPDQAISTIHKAKGLECPAVLIAPCDSGTFRDTPAARKLLYVALSRATRDLMLVVSRGAPSPLFQLP
jgi:hypothetical protein